MLNNEASDRMLLQKVNQRLARAGSGSQSKITVTVRKGDVTLSGTIQYEMQRRTITRAASSVSGVRRVIDQMQIAPRRPRGV